MKVIRDDIRMNKESYNAISRQWADSRNNSFVSKLVIDFANQITPGGKILDVGCGTGLPLAGYLAERGFNVTGIDASDQMIEVAKSLNIKSAQFTCCDFFDFNSMDQFDGILAWDSLWHFPKEKQESIYPKVSGLLKSGGYLLFTHGNVDGEHVNTMMGESFYYSSLSKELVYKLLRGNGFEIEAVLENFIERDTDRAFVVLARKM